MISAAVAMMVALLWCLSSVAAVLAIWTVHRSQLDVWKQGQLVIYLDDTDYWRVRSRI